MAFNGFQMTLTTSALTVSETRRIESKLSRKRVAAEVEQNARHGDGGPERNHQSEQRGQQERHGMLIAHVGVEIVRAQH